MNPSMELSLVEANVLVKPVVPTQRLLKELLRMVQRNQEK